MLSKMSELQAGLNEYVEIRRAMGGLGSPKKESAQDSEDPHSDTEVPSSTP